MTDDEKWLVESAKRGEAEAFGALYDRYLPKIYRFVFLKTGEKETSEDIVHQVFLKAWQSIGRYEDRGFPFSSWLYRMARNAVVDHYRSKRNFIQIEEADDETMVVAGFEESLSILTEVETVKKCLARLNPDYQDILIMRFIEELSYEETAKVLGKSEGAVRVLQHRALKSLKLLIKKDGKEIR